LDNSKFILVNKNPLFKTVGIVILAVFFTAFFIKDFHNIRLEHIIVLLVITVLGIWVYVRNISFTEKIAKNNNWRYSSERNPKSAEDRMLYSLGQEDFTLKGNYNDIPFEFYTTENSLKVEIPGDYKFDEFSLYCKYPFPLKELGNGWAKVNIAPQKTNEVFIAYRPKKYLNEKFQFPETLADQLCKLGKKYSFNFYIEHNKFVYSSTKLGYYNNESDKEKSMKLFLKEAYIVRSLFV